MQSKYQKLFDHLATEHNLVLVESELGEILDICEDILAEPAPLSAEELTTIREIIKRTKSNER